MTIIYINSYLLSKSSFLFQSSNIQKDLKPLNFLKSFELSMYNFRVTRDIYIYIYTGFLSGILCCSFSCHSVEVGSSWQTVKSQVSTVEMAITNSMGIFCLLWGAPVVLRFFSSCFSLFTLLLSVIYQLLKSNFNSPWLLQNSLLCPCFLFNYFQHPTKIFHTIKKSDYKKQLFTQFIFFLSRASKFL